jgi:regulatory protein
MGLSTMSKIMEKTRGPSKRKKRSARAYAMDHLARREMSFYELVARMVKAEYPEDEAYETVEQLRLENLQNDERFVEAYVLSKTRRGAGPKKICYEIRAKQVKAVLVSQELVKYERQWLDIALRILQKRYYPAELKDLATKQKAFQYLLRKGHDTAIIYQALHVMLEQEKVDNL